MSIHPTAIVHPKAEVDPSVEIGPYCQIGEHVRIGPDNRLMQGVIVTGHTELGEGNTIHPYVVLGTAPQDISYQGEPTRLVIGSHNVLREYVTMNRGTIKGGGITTVGSHNYLMTYCHIAHDCDVEDHIIMANAVNIAGHVKIESAAVFGGMVGVQHFTSIGRMAFIGGLSRLVQDVPPYMIAEGIPGRVRGVNVVGLRRNGLSDEEIDALKEAYRLLWRYHLNTTEALDLIQSRSGTVSEHVRYLFESVEQTRRGRQGRGREVLRQQESHSDGE